MDRHRPRLRVRLCLGDRLIINQLYELIVLGQFGFWTIVAFVLLAGMLFQIFRPMPHFAWTDEDETNSSSAVNATA